MQTHQLRFQSIARTHAGTVRSCNEDAVLERPETGLWVVADGMGGHSAGDVASAFIVDALRQMPAEGGAVRLETATRNALARANAEIHRRSHAQTPKMTMGATVVAFGVDDKRFFCLWAGDSRLYRLENGKLKQLTRDHRFIQDLLDSGALDSKGAGSHPLRNVITRAVGIDPELQLDWIHGAIEPGDVFLLVTDGVAAACSDEDIAGILAERSIEDAADAIMEQSLARGAPDNLSLILVRHLAG